MVLPSLHLTNRLQRILLTIGIFFYLVGDILTTQIGFMVGYSELNPIKEIWLMIVAKTIVIILILIFLKIIKQPYLKIVLLTMLIIVGLFVGTLRNILIIVGII